MNSKFTQKYVSVFEFLDAKVYDDGESAQKQPWLFLYPISFPT